LRYVVVGDLLQQALEEAAHYAFEGGVVCSNQAREWISQALRGGRIDVSCVSVDLRCHFQRLKRITIQSRRVGDFILQARIIKYVATEALPNLRAETDVCEYWGNEVRRCSVMFAELGWHSNKSLIVVYATKLWNNFMRF
jgi:hypothetical protein